MSKDNRLIKLGKTDLIGSLALQLYDSDTLIGLQKRRGDAFLLPYLIAELYIRYWFSRAPELRTFLDEFLPENCRSQLLDECPNSLYDTPRFATDLDNGASRKIKEAVEERWNLYAHADGAFPVCSNSDAFLLPFTLETHKDGTPWAVDQKDKEIPEWADAIAALKLNYRIKVMLPEGHLQLTGHSLQLPVFLAALVKDGKFPPFDPFRFIATGAIDEKMRLAPVRVWTKYEVLRKKYRDVVFTCPQPREDCPEERADDIAIMPNGVTLQEIRNFCIEQVLYHNLLKGEISRDKDFFGRDRELMQIHQLLNPSNKQQKKIPLLLGPSGIGKTTLALQYGKITHPFEYPNECILLDAGSGMKSLPEIFSKFWSNPINKEKFDFDIPDEIKDPDEKFKMLIYQLERKRRRILLILDNLSEDLQLNAEIRTRFNAYRESSVDLIATATVCRFITGSDDIVSHIEISGLSETDGFALLKHKRQIDNLEESKAAYEIVRFLGGNAWALDVLGEILKQEPEKFDDDYREKLKELQIMPLQAMTTGTDMVRIGHGGAINPKLLLKPVLEKLSPSELEIAQVAACCAPEYIYPEWLQDFYTIQHNIRFENEKQWRRKNFVAKLRQVSILTKTESTNAEYRLNYYFRMHRLTRLVIRELYKDNITKNESLLVKIISQRDLGNNPTELIAAGYMLKNISSAYKASLDLLTSNDENLLALLLRHNQYALALALVSSYLKLLDEAGFYTRDEYSNYKALLLSYRVDINIVKQDFSQALTDIECVCKLQQDAEATKSCLSLCKKANVYIWRKEFDCAANCLDAAYDIIEKHDLHNTYTHSEYLTRRAILDNWMKRYESAEKNLKSALAIKGKLHSSPFKMIYLLHLLGDCCRYRGNFKESLDIYDRCEQYYLERFGEKNLSTARLFVNKASTLSKCGKYLDAISYLQRALKTHEDYLGQNHKFTRHDYLKLSEIYNILGKTGSAKFYKNKL